MKNVLQYCGRLVRLLGRLRRPLLVLLALSIAGGTHFLATIVLPIRPPQVAIFNKSLGEYRKDRALVEQGLLDWTPFDADKDLGEQSTLAFDEQAYSGLWARLLYGPLDAERVFLRCDMLNKLGVIYAKMHPSEPDNKVNAMHWFEYAAACNPGSPFSDYLSVDQVNAFARQRLAISRNIDELYKGGGKGNPKDMQQSGTPDPKQEQQKRDEKKQQEQKDQEKKEQNRGDQQPQQDQKKNTEGGNQPDQKDKKKQDGKKPNAGQKDQNPDDAQGQDQKDKKQGEGQGKSDQQSGEKGNNPGQSNVPPPEKKGPAKDDRNHEKSEGGGSPDGAPASVDGRKNDVNDAI